MSVLKVLIVEDEEAIQDLLAQVLEQAGMQVAVVGSAEEALHCLAEIAIDLILLDWKLPGISGPDLIRYLKNDERYKKLPFILLTARGEEADIVRGLEVGADDYMTKPFSPKELILRIKSVARRHGKLTASTILRVGDLTLNRDQYSIILEGQVLNLSPTHLRLMEFFMENPGKVHSRSHLLNYVWNDQNNMDERTIDVHILRLRNILVKYGHRDLIRTVRDYGYQLAIFDEKPSK